MNWPSIITSTAENMNKRQVSQEPSQDKRAKPQPYHINQVHHRIAGRYGYEERSFRATFDQSYLGQRLVDVHQDLEDMFQGVIDKAAEHHGPQDRARVIIQHNDLKQDIIIHMRPQHLITGQTIMNRIEKDLQSDESLSIFQVDFGILQNDRGGGLSKKNH